MINKVLCGNAEVELKKLPDNYVDLTVTSPPYDNLRDYDGYSFNFEKIADELFKVTKEGGVVVWIIKDESKNHDESGTSFKHALYFKEIGFKLYDTLIYNKEKVTFPHKNMYYDSFEYMFVFSKGKPKTVNLLKDRKNNWGGSSSWGNVSQREKDGSLTKKGKRVIPEYGVRFNVWRYMSGYGHSTKDLFTFEHPATFPEALVRDHIMSWSNEGDLVLDPLCGSGTTLKMAKLLNRNYLGIEISEKYCKISEKRIPITVTMESNQD